MGRGGVLNPGGVPQPPFDATVYRIGDERTRMYLTGDLPRPTYKSSGVMRCGLCHQSVVAREVTTHVPGARPVRMLVDHQCVRPVT